MSKQFEHDDLLQELKVTAKSSPSPKLDEQILVDATLSSDDRESSIRQISRKPITWLAGFGATAAIAVLAFSPATAPSSKPQFSPFQLSTSFKFNLALSSSEDARFSRVWVPEVVAKAGPSLSNSSESWGPLYEAVSTYDPQEYAKFLASYFGVEGEVTKERGFSAADFELGLSTADFEFYQIYDPEKEIKITIFPRKNSGIAFSVIFQNPKKNLETPATQGEKNTLHTLLQDLAISKSDTSYRAIEFADVRVTQKNKFSIAEANQIVDGREMDLGFSAIFNDGGQLRELYGSLVQFDYKGTVPTVSEADAISRLGDYWDNPFRVYSAEDSLTFASTKHCENEPKFPMKCETTVDKAVHGFSVSRDRDGKMWLVPSYAMYHNGHFIGAVNAMSEEYLNVPG